MMVTIWSLLHRKLNSRYRTTSFKSLHRLSTLSYSLNGKAQNHSQENLGKSLNFSKRIVINLTPQIVHSTLLNCPSDLIALSFFLWCAKQPNYFHNYPAFDHMSTVVNRLNERLKTVRGIVKELERIGCVIKPQTFLVLLRIYWRGGMYALVFEVLDEMGSYGFVLNKFARNVMMDVLFKIGCVDVALNVLRETQVPNFLSFNIAICNLCKLNDLSNLHLVVRSMLKEGYHPNVETFELVLNCFCKVGRFEEVFQVLGLMITLGFRISVAVWSMLIDGFCKFGKPCMASDLFRKMVESGSSPNVVTYTSLIKSFMESHNIDNAFDILRIMESKGCAPDRVFCNVLIDCFSKVGRYNDAVDVFVGLRKRNLEPDCYSFSSILRTICLSQKFSLLPNLLGGYEVQADLVVCNCLLSYFNNVGSPSYAMKLYNDMVERGFLPDKYTFVGLLGALCKARRLDEAINAYRGIIMSHSGLDAHIHTVIVDGLIKMGKFHAAVRLFRKAVAGKYQLDVVSYTVAIIGLLKGGRTEEACILYRQMKDVGIDPNAHAYNLMLSCFCKKSDVNLVKETLQEMIDAGIGLNFSTFIRLNNFLNKSNSSQQVFDQIIRIWDLGLMPENAMRLLLLSELSPGSKPSDAHHPLLGGYLKDNIFVEPASSDDLSDVAASMG